MNYEVTLSLFFTAWPSPRLISLLFFSSFPPFSLFFIPPFFALPRTRTPPKSRLDHQAGQGAGQTGVLPRRLDHQASQGDGQVGLHRPRKSGLQLF